MTDQPTSQRTKRGEESRRMRLKILEVLHFRMKIIQLGAANTNGALYWDKNSQFDKRLEVQLCQAMVDLNEYWRCDALG